MKHIHADLIHAWADGAEIQFADGAEIQFADHVTIKWTDTTNPVWGLVVKYRIKPDDPPKEPIRAWANCFKGNVVRTYIEKETAVKYSALSGRSAIPLIEEGYCQMIPHDGSDKCPVGFEFSVCVREKDGCFESWNSAEYVTWENITHYAVILKLEDNK